MRRVPLCLLPLVGAAVLVGAVLPPATGAVRSAATPTTGATNLDWPQFLHDPSHSSVSPATAITKANGASMAQVWRWQPPKPSGSAIPHLDSSPVVSNGSVYIGVEDGNFYALNESTGAVRWSRSLDNCFSPGVTSPFGRGITATAAVVPDPTTGTPTVYEDGAKSLYAMNAATGAIEWQTRIAPVTTDAHLYYLYGSPMVIGGHIYQDMSAGCGGPEIRGGVVELDQHTGAVLNTWNSVPSGSIGGGIWSTAMASPSGTDIWVTTGSDCSLQFGGKSCPPGNQVGNSISIVHLSASLKFSQAWQLPNGTNQDWDFGSSATLFGGADGVPLSVGACNKDGDYYALQASPLGTTPRWTDDLGAPAGPNGLCVGSAVWDKVTNQLFLPGGTATTIGGTSFGGSISSVNPATGAYLWRTGLPCGAVGSPSTDSAGVLAVATWSCPSASDKAGAYLVNASTGAIISKLPVSGRVFSQPVYAQGNLLVAGQTSGLYSFAPKSAGRR